METKSLFFFPKKKKGMHRRPTFEAYITKTFSKEREQGPMMGLTR
jgi:hypothetical protein